MPATPPCRRRVSASRPARSRRASRQRSVGGRKRLRFLQLHLVTAAREAALTRLVAEDLRPASVAEVPLAELHRHAAPVPESGSTGKLTRAAARRHAQASPRGHAAPAAPCPAPNARGARTPA